jgi:hypothetical protein
MVTYAITPCGDGHWNVCRASTSLFTGLRMAEAIRLAKEVASDEFRRSGRVTSVDMPGPQSTIRLAHYMLPASPVAGRTTH